MTLPNELTFQYIIYAEVYQTHHYKNLCYYKIFPIVNSCFNIIF